MKKINQILIIICLSILSFNTSVFAEKYFVEETPYFDSAKINSDGTVTFIYKSSSVDKYDLNYEDEGEDEDYEYPDFFSPDNLELYRSEEENGDYISVVSTAVDYKNNSGTLEDKSAIIGKTYYYKCRYNSNVDGTLIYSDFSAPLKVVVVPTPGKIKYVRATKAKTFTIKWNKTDNVDGYNIYMKEFDNKYLYYMHDYSTWETSGVSKEEENLNDDLKKMEYKLVKSVSPDTTSIKYNKASHGKGYLFAIKSFKNVDGKKVEGSTYYASHGVMDYYFCYNAENTKYKYKWPKTEKQARKLCTTIKVKMWDFKNHTKHSGAKKTRVQYITVNKKYADTIKQIYSEIYKDKSKPPIYEAGSYRWRPNESSWSYHSVGTAIDMNCNENPMYSYTYTKSGKVKKKIIVGSFYKPKTNPYSMPRNGVIEKTFAKYGFSRLENDLMHYNADWVYASTNY